MNLPSFEHPSHGRCQIEPIQKLVRPETLAQAESVFLLVQGMGCPICAVRVHNSLLQQRGVLAVSVSLERGLVRVYYDPVQVSPESLPAVVSEAGDGKRHRYKAQILA